MINMKKLRGWTGSAAARTIGLSLATLVCAAAPLSVVKAEGRADSLGTEFWVGFPTNEGPATLSLFVSSDDAAMGTVEIPGLGFATTFTVVPGVVTTVALPPNAQNTTYGTVTNLGVHVTASSEVSVYGLSRRQFTTDAYLGLPVDVLGMEYVALGYSQLNASLPSQAMVVATQDGTRVESPGLNDCAPFDVTLNTGQSYLVGCQDVSGMPFSASAPVALFAGLESIGGLILAGVIIGIIQSLTTNYLDPLIGGSLGSVVPYIIMLAILLIRPTGLFGWRTIERV